jgi:hypothetical protein
MLLVTDFPPNGVLVAYCRINMLLWRRLKYKS